MGVLTVGVLMGWCSVQAISNAVKVKPAMILLVDFIMCGVKKVAIIVYFGLLTSCVFLSPQMPVPIRHPFVGG